MVQKIFVQLTADVLEVLLATSFCFAGEGAAAYDPAEISSARQTDRADDDQHQQCTSKSRFQWSGCQLRCISES